MRDFKLVLLGQFLSQLGTAAHTVAVMFYVKYGTGSSTAIGIVLAASGVVSLLFSPIGGVLADRLDRRTVVIFCDLVNAVATLLLITFVFFVPPVQTTVGVFAITICSMIINAVGAFLRPAINAMLPELVDHSRLQSANSLYRTGFKLGELTGNLFGGVFYKAVGAPILFLINSISYFIAAALTTLTSFGVAQKSESKRLKKTSVRIVINDLRDGMHLLMGFPGAWQFFLMALTINALAAPVFLLLPFHVENQIGGDAASYGVVVSGLLLGSLIGYFFAGLIKIPTRVRVAVVIAAVTIMCCAFIFVAIAPTIRLMFVAMVVAGIANGFWSILFETAMQTCIPREYLGRIFGVFGTLSGALTPIAIAVGGVIGDLSRKNTVAIFISCAIAMILTLLILACDSRFRQFFAKL
jgi:DHA3 family macrolide efflux protein-like MFS transporter